ncbi:MAG: nucleoside hydrolase [Chloroflexi bacterium]|nr:nucleoside hydrolase [Chloroflexota bacterium]
MTSSNRKKVIMDMDPGVDDALAIIMAIHSPELEVLAITTVAGNVGIDHCVKNTLRVLALLDLENPPIVARGAEKALKAKPHDAASVHGEDGLGALGDAYYPELNWDLVTDEPAADLMARLVAEHPGEVTVMADGPITNVAEAIRRHPKEMAKAKAIQAMTGAIHVPGNIPPVGAAEFDAYCDPDALAEVLDFTVPVFMVPLDVTHAVPLQRDIAQYEFGRRTDRISKFVLDSSVHYMDFYRDDQGHDGCYLHDPLNVAIAAFPTIARTEAMRIHVDTSDSLTRGLTLPYHHPRLKKAEPNCHVALKVDTERTMRLFWERVRGD